MGREVETRSQGMGGVTLLSAVEWQEIARLIDAARYQRAATLLRQGQAKTGSDSLLSSSLAALAQLSLICGEYHEAIKAHEKAGADAAAREHHLRERILLILSLAAGKEIKRQRAEGEDEATAVQSLWQRVLGLFGREIDVVTTALISAPPPKDEGSRQKDQPGPYLRVYWRRPPGKGLRKGRDRIEEADELGGTETVYVPQMPDAYGTRYTATDQPRAPVQPHAAEGGPSLVVYCLGPFSVYQNETLITEWNGSKGLAILKYMIAHRGKPIAKEVLMEIVWPNSDPQAARRNLHQAIYSLRQSLRPGGDNFQHIQFHNESYRLNPDLNLWVDLVEFESYIVAGQRLETEEKIDEAMEAYGIAEGMYGGDFLEDDLFEEWTIGTRERLRSLYLKTVDRLAQHHMERHEYTMVNALCHRVLGRDPYYESARRRLMECYLAQGQRHLAIRQHQICVRLLGELDLEPSPETEEVYLRIISSN